jgi:hypothetical protein
MSAGPLAVLPDRALYLPTFSHFLIVNKTSLSLSLSIALSLFTDSVLLRAVAFSVYLVDFSGFLL